MWDIFLSYSHSDRHMAEWLLQRLEKAGLSVWWDEYYVESFDKHIQRISEGISESRAFLALLTEKYAMSNYAKEELKVAVRTFYVIREHCPSFKRSIIFALADHPIFLPDSCIELLDLGEYPPHKELFNIDDQHSWRSWTLASQMQLARIQSGVVSTPSYVLFPVDVDDLERAAVLVDYAVAKWSREFKKIWADTWGSDYPKADSDTSVLVRRVWDWILPLKRYGECPVPAILRYHDCVEENRTSEDFEGTLTRFEAAAENIMLAKAAYHLWKGREFSLVFDPCQAMMSPGGGGSYTPTSHFGTPTSNLIGLSRMDKRAVYSLVDLLFVVPRGASIIYDLSILAAMIVSYERYWRRLPDYEAVQRSIIDPLLKGDDILDEFY